MIMNLILIIISISSSSSSSRRTRGGSNTHAEAVAAAPACIGWHYLSNASLIRPQLFYVLCIVSRITISCQSNHSPLLKKTCVRRVVIDKWLSLSIAKQACARRASYAPWAIPAGVVAH